MQGWINNFAAAWQIVTTVLIVILVLAMPAKVRSRSPEGYTIHCCCEYVLPTFVTH